jgi:hypothetical protein
MEEDYSEYMLQPGDIPLGKEEKKIEGVKSVGRVFLGFLGILVLVRLLSDGQAPEAEFIVSFCGLLTMVVVFAASLNRGHILVTTINGKKESRPIVNAGLTRFMKSIHEWDDELFNEIMIQHGAVFGEINLEQFTELYEIDVSARVKELLSEADLKECEHHADIRIEALFKAIDTDNNGMVSLEDIKQGCSRGYENAYPHKFMTELEEKKKRQVMAEYKASKSN